MKGNSTRPIITPRVHYSITPSDRSRLAAEADVVVEVEQIEPRGDVFAVLRGFGMEFVEVGARFGIGGHALFLQGPGQHPQGGGREGSPRARELSAP